MCLEIRLLGAVELRLGSRPAALGASKRRAVLAGLALDANRPVSLHRLAEMAWPDTPPPSAVANLRTHVAALRRVVGDRIVARQSAYELRLAPDELDVTEFRRLAAAGRASVAAGDCAAAIPPLTAALALCRGAAGEGVPRGTTLDGHWVSLDQQRLQIFDDLMQARLGVGEDAGLVDGLRRHLAAHPLRERAWAHLMVALYRGGDASAALSAYRQARSVLDEQLGIEPGPELARLHRAILGRSADLLAPARPADPASQPRPGTGRPWTPAPAVRAEARPTPRELPPDVATFVGRARELSAVVEALRPPAPAVVVIAGAPGAGKSALAVRAAHLLRPDFPDGEIYIDLGYRPSVPPGEVAGRALRALGVARADVPDDVDERAGRLRSLMAGRRLLIIVDGVARAGQVRPLLPAGPGPGLVAVGHRQLGSLDGARRITLDALGAAEATALLAAYAGAGRLAAEPGPAGELVRLCAGSPLALRIAGSRLADRPGMPVAAVAAAAATAAPAATPAPAASAEAAASVASAAGRCSDAGQRLDWFDYEDLSVRDSLAAAVVVLRAADELAARAFELMGAGGGAAVPADRLAACLEVSPALAAYALDRLVDFHLAERDGAGYLLPPLIHAYAAEIAGPQLASQSRVLLRQAALYSR